MTIWPKPTRMFQAALLSSPSARIAGGSDEILRNIIAERVLGLPADIRVDKDKPFNQVPHRQAVGLRPTRTGTARAKQHGPVDGFT